jgi:hypothetical protein
METSASMRVWVGGVLAALVAGLGGFFAVRSLTANWSAASANPGLQGGFPGGPGGPGQGGGFGGPAGFGGAGPAPVQLPTLQILPGS